MNLMLKYWRAFMGKLKSFLTSIDAIYRAETQQELEDNLKKIAASQHYDFYLMEVSLPQSLARGTTIIYTNYPSDWLDHYDTNNYINQDPIVKYCINSTQAICWHELRKIKNSKVDNIFFNDAAKYGLRSGLSVPIHGSKGEMGIFSLASKQPSEGKSHKEIEQSLMVAQTVATGAFSRMLLLYHSKNKRDDLTKRERDSLYWAAEGKTTWEISQILTCSERTVYFHLNNASKKLKVVNRYQAISQAILLGYIHPAIYTKNE